MYRSKFFILHNNVEQEHEMIKDNGQSLTACSGGFISHVSGMDLCGELIYPNASMVDKSPYFPLTGHKLE